MERSHTHASGLKQKESFPANNAISLGICSLAPLVLLLRLLASPSFPLLTVLPAACTYSQVPTIMGTFFVLSALLLMQASPGCLSSLGYMAKKHQHDGTESRGISCSSVFSHRCKCRHSLTHSFTHSLLHSFNK